MAVRAGAAACVAPNAWSATDGEGPVGIQLFKVAQSLKQDIPGTLARLRTIGFEYIETAGFAGLSAREFRTALDSAGLKCPSAHLPFDAGNLGLTFDEAHVLGVQYVTSSLLRLGTGRPPDAALDPTNVAHSAGHIPPLPAMTLDDAKRSAELANRIGAAAKAAGLIYAYHNHYFEFVPQNNGDVGYDTLLRETDPELVKFEIDCGWMIVAGRDPIAYFKRYPQRFPMIHAKDFAPLAHADAARKAFIRSGVELGRGFIDYRPIIAAARAAGLRYVFAEQEGPFVRMSQMEAAGIAYKYLRAVGA